MLTVIPLSTRDTLVCGSDYTYMTDITWRKGLNSGCPGSSWSIFTYSNSPPSLLWKSHWMTSYLWLPNMIFTLPKGNLSLQLKYTLNSLALAPPQVSEATWWRLVGVAESQQWHRQLRQSCARVGIYGMPNKDFRIWCLIQFSLTRTGSLVTCSERIWAKSYTLSKLFKVFSPSTSICHSAKCHDLSLFSLMLFSTFSWYIPFHMKLNYAIL